MNIEFSQPEISYHFNLNFYWQDIVDAPQFVIDGFTPSDIDQGLVGDCWVLAAIGSLALDPALFNQVRMVTFKITFNIQMCYGQDTQMSASNNAYFLPSILEPQFSFINVCLLHCYVLHHMHGCKLCMVVNHVWL